MTVRALNFLCDRVLIDLCIEHGFGQKGAQPPENTVFPIQVHGREVFEVSASDVSLRPRADIVITATPGISIGIVTADCVPVLIATEDGSAVGTIHAGWRGLAGGVLETGLRAMRQLAKGANLIAAVGPAARGCCYEIDHGVRNAIVEKYSAGLEGVIVPGRADHFQFDLARLATWVLGENGVDCQHIGIQHRLCTICDGDRFESYRRDAEAAGRLAHFITCPQPGGQG
jgi:YfiH family protein